MPEAAEPLKNEIGYMTQIFSYYRDLTVMENLRFAAEIYGIPPKAAATRIDELLHTYDLTTNVNQLSGSMSGGQRQKLALAGSGMWRSCHWQRLSRHLKLNVLIHGDALECPMGACWH